VRRLFQSATRSAHASFGAPNPSSGEDRRQARHRAGPHHPEEPFQRRGYALRESIRGADVSSSSHLRQPDTGINANDAIMELMLMIDAAVGAPRTRHRVPVVRLQPPDKKSTAGAHQRRAVARMLEAAAPTAC